MNDAIVNLISLSLQKRGVQIPVEKPLIRMDWFIGVYSRFKGCPENLTLGLETDKIANVDWVKLIKIITDEGERFSKDPNIVRIHISTDSVYKLFSISTSYKMEGITK